MLKVVAGEHEQAPIRAQVPRGMTIKGMVVKPESISPVACAMAPMQLQQLAQLGSQHSKAVDLLLVGQRGFGNGQQVTQ